MSYNIRERFRERKFSYKIKKQLDKESEIEETEKDSIKDSPLKFIIFSPLIFTSFIKNVIDYFKSDNNTINSYENSSDKDTVNISLLNNKKITNDNNYLNDDIKVKNKYSNNKTNVKIINNNIFHKKKKKNIQNTDENRNINKNNQIYTNINEEKTNTKKKLNIIYSVDKNKDNINSNILETKIFLKLKKNIEKLDNEFKDIESEIYLINKYSDDNNLLEEATIINNKIQILFDRLDKVSDEFSIIKDEKLILTPFLLNDSLLIDDIINYRQSIKKEDLSTIPNKLKILDEYNHLFMNIEELEKNISDINAAKNKREDELSKRDKNFSKAKNKLANLYEIESNCDSIINKHNKYLDNLSKNVKKVDEKKFINYKLKGFDGLISSSLKYIGLLGLYPFRGIIPSIALKTNATRKLISSMIKNIHYEKNEKIIYSVNNYITEINNKIYDINNVYNNIDNAYYDVQKLKQEFKDYYFKYNLKEYYDVYKKIEMIEESIINDRNKIINIKNSLIKNREVNNNVLKKVKKLNNKNS